MVVTVVIMVVFVLPGRWCRTVRANKHFVGKYGQVAGVVALSFTVHDDDVEFLHAEQFTGTGGDRLAGFVDDLDGRRILGQIVGVAAIVPWRGAAFFIGAIGNHRVDDREGRQAVDKGFRTAADPADESDVVTIV